MNAEILSMYRYPYSYTIILFLLPLSYTSGHALHTTSNFENKSQVIPYLRTITNTRRLCIIPKPTKTIMIAVEFLDMNDLNFVTFG